MHRRNHNELFLFVIVIVLTFFACSLPDGSDGNNNVAGIIKPSPQVISPDQQVFSLQDIPLPEVVIGPDTIVQTVNVQPLTADQLDTMFILDTEGDAIYHAEQSGLAAYAESQLFAVVSQDGQNQQASDYDFCGSKIIEADLDPGIEGVEQYVMVSLLDCQGVNYVTPVKGQVEGTCGTYAETAAMEINMARFLLPRDSRPVTADHPIDDFSPINLSEGYRLYAGYISPSSAPVITAPAYRTWFGATLNEFLPDSELNPYGPWSPYKTDALERQYSQVSEYCLDMEEQPGTTDYQRYSDLLRCVFDVAKQHEYPFIDYDESDRVYLGDGRDYETIERNVRLVISTGRPVVVKGSWWYWDGSQASLLSEDAATGAPFSPYYQFVLLHPRPEADYQHDDQGDVLIPYRVEGHALHVVVIVGYLRGTQGNDYWIIKNSHGDREGGSTKDTFLLIRTPNTSGDVKAPDSTKRNFYNSAFFIQNNWKFYQLSSDTQTIAQVLAAENSDLAESDRDGDGVIDWYDNCPTTPNPDQADGDLDFIGDTCDPCDSFYDRYQYQSNPNLFLVDYDLDGTPDVCDQDGTLDLGAVILGPEGRDFAMQTQIFPYGQWNKSWVLSIDDQILGVGRFSMDYREGVLIRNSGAMGIIFRSGALNGYGKIYFYNGDDTPEDNMIGDWLLEKEDQVVGIGNFFPDPPSGDTKDSVIFFNPEKGFGFVSFVEENIWEGLAVFEIGERIGNWTVGPDDVIEGLGDFDGDGREDIMIQSPDRLGIITVSDAGVFSDLVIVEQGELVGDWSYGTYGFFGDHVVGIGDFYGTGADQILIRNASELAVLRFARNKLWSLAIISNNTRLENWVYQTADRVVGVGDFDKNGQEEIMLQSDSGIVLLTADDVGGFTELRLVLNGQRMGDWMLTPEDQILYMGDFSQNGAADFVIRNDTGFAIITIAPHDELISLYVYPYDIWLGDWYLREFNDMVFGEFAVLGENSIFVRSIAPAYLP